MMLQNDWPNFQLLAALKTHGLETVNDLIESKQEETLHLEFKVFANSSSSNLSKDDRRLIAKSVCGFSNAEGGILVIGIATTRSEGVDVANAKQPLDNANLLRNRVLSGIPEMLSPQNSKIEVHSITQQESGAGFVVIAVPPSESRPHQSNVHHQYFRRGSDGTRVMEHGEIRELFFLPREGKLSLQYRMRNTARAGKIFAFDFLLSLRNEGKVAVTAPFVRVGGPVAFLVSDPDPLFTRRRLTNGNWGIYANRDVLLHVGDEIDVAAVRTGFHLHESDEYESKYFIRKIVLEQRRPLFSIRTPNEGRDNPRPYDKLIDAEIAFGGENAAIQNAIVKLDNWTMFEMMAKVLPLE